MGNMCLPFPSPWVNIFSNLQIPFAWTVHDTHTHTLICSVCWWGELQQKHRWNKEFPDVYSLLLSFLRHILNTYFSMTTCFLWKQKNCAKKIWKANWWNSNMLRNKKNNRMLCAFSCFKFYFLVFFFPSMFV